MPERQTGPSAGPPAGFRARRAPCKASASTRACGPWTGTAQGLGQRPGVPPTRQGYDNVARSLEAAAKHAKGLGLALGIEPVNRYESHLVNTGWQARWLVGKVGADNMLQLGRANDLQPPGYELPWT